MSEPRTTPLALEPWTVQSARWPTSGKHILAQYDEDLIWVYQAYRPEIADWAVQHQRFGGPWSRGRMTWIKPSAVWMAYRCGWTLHKDANQSNVLALDLDRAEFERLLMHAVVSHGPGGGSFKDNGGAMFTPGKTPGVHFTDKVEQFSEEENRWVLCKNLRMPVAFHACVASALNRTD